MEIITTEEEYEKALIDHDKIHDQLGKMLKDIDKTELNPFAIEFDPKYEEFRKLRKKFGALIHLIHNYHLQKAILIKDHNSLCSK